MTLNSTLYQIQHPWHWLTYGNNAAGVADIIAVLALLGAALYTSYTRRMRDLAEERARAEDSPLLQVTQSRKHPATVSITVRNLGLGPALNVICWSEFGSYSFRRAGEFREREKGQFADILGALPGRQPSEVVTHTHTLNEPASDSYFLIVECSDITGWRKQTHILQTSSGTRSWMIVSERARATTASRAVELHLPFGFTLRLSGKAQQ